MTDGWRFWLGVAILLGLQAALLHGLWPRAQDIIHGHPWPCAIWASVSAAALGLFVATRNAAVLPPAAVTIAIVFHFAFKGIVETPLDRLAQNMDRLMIALGVH